MASTSLPDYTRHPDFPSLPTTAPLTYALAMRACLSEVPSERPSFTTLVELLSNASDEIASGSYVGCDGLLTVRPMLQSGQ